jgi:hypothetical protein
VVELDDEDHLRTFEAFAELRRRVVKVSADFGERLAVRLMALRAADEHGDPGIVDITLGTAAEGLTLLISPLKPPDEDGSDGER